MNHAELIRYRELNAKANWTEDELAELEDLDINRERQEEADLAVMGRTYAAIEREDMSDIAHECVDLGLVSKSGSISD